MSTRRVSQDDGVSVVIGAILILGLLVATTVTIRVNYVPIWEKDTEAAHMRLIESQLASLKSELDRQIDNRTTVPVAHPLSLGTVTSGVFTRGTSNGVVTFAPASRPFTVSTNRFLVQQENGVSYLGLQETWTAISGTVTLETVGTVHSLRLRLATISQNHAGDAVTITATDANSAFAGDLRVLVSTSGAADWRVNVRVRDASSTTLADNAATFPNDQAQAPYWVDAVDPQHRFDRVLDAAAKPVRLSIAVANVNSGGSNQDLSAEYAITYQQSGTNIILGGGGLQRNDYTATHTGGLLQYEADNDRFPEQDYFLEHGALLLQQPDGTAFRIDPPFQVSLSGSTTDLTITLPTLTGSQGSVQGSETAIIYSHTVAQTRILAQAPKLTLTLTTNQPAVWTALWTDQLLDLPGFVQNTHFSTSTTATTATLNVFGLTSDPNSLTYDLYVTFRQAQIELDLKG